MPAFAVGNYDISNKMNKSYVDLKYMHK